MTPSRFAVEERGVRLARRRPAADLRQLHATDGGVDVGHAGVEPDDLVLVLRLHALVAEQPDGAHELGVESQLTMPPSPLVMFFVG